MPRFVAGKFSLRHGHRVRAKGGGARPRGDSSCPTCTPAPLPLVASIHEPPAQHTAHASPHPPAERRCLGWLLAAGGTLRPPRIASRG